MCDLRNRRGLAVWSLRGAGSRVGLAYMLRPPIVPMLARLVPELPRPGQPGGDLLVEPKFDGFRVIGFCLADRVYLQSRAGRNLTSYFPDIARLLRRLPANVVVDGVISSEAAAAHYVRDTPPSLPKSS